MAGSLPGQVPYAAVGGPSDFAVASNAALRKRKMAEMLQQQAFKPNEVGLIPGSKMSLANPLAALLNSYVSNKLEKESDTEEAAANKAAQEGMDAHIAAMPQAVPAVDSVPIEQEQVGPPPAPPGAPPAGLAAAFGASGMSGAGTPPMDNEFKGSGSPLAAQLLGGGPPQADPLAPPPGAAPAGPPLLPQKMDMGSPDMLPKMNTDAIPGKEVTASDLYKWGAGFNKFGKAGERMAEQVQGGAVKAMMPMSPTDVAEMQAKQATAKDAMQQRADAAKMRSEDMRLSVQQRETAAREHNALMRELAAGRAAAAAAGKSGSFPGGPEGYSVDGNVVLRGKDGIPREVINGVPSKDPYGGPITPNVDQRKGVADATKGAQGIADMKGALAAVEKDPSLFGLRANVGSVLPDIGGLSQKAGGLSKDQLKQQSKIASMTANITHSLYGSAFSAGEQARAKKFLINATDSADQVRAKLEGRMELEQEHYDSLPASAKASSSQRQNKGVTVDF